MSNVKNITRVYLLNVPLENDYKNTLFFDNPTHQENYFKSRIVARFSDFNYQRKEETIKLPDYDDNHLSTSYDDLIKLGVNYVMYQNTKHSNKWFYAFIKDIRYFSEGKTDIDIELDVIQTWYFDYTIKESFVEREHVDDDTVGLHIQPENLETGEYISILNSNVDFGEMYIVIGTTHDGIENVQGGIYGGCYSGVKYLYYKRSNYSEVNEFLDKLANDAKSEAITSIFIVPEFLVKGYEQTDDGVVDGSFQSHNMKFTIGKNVLGGMLGSYSPHNKKLLTYPFNYLLVSNNNGGSAVYRYEDFDSDNCDFEIDGTICPGGSIKISPCNYKGVAKNVEESLNGGKYPICNWNTDVYTNWLTQNSMNLALSKTAGALSIATGVATLNAEAVSSGLFGIANVMAQKYQQSLTPPQAEGNINCGDVLTAMGNNSISMYQMTIKEQTAILIDKFFDMFGYQVNHVKVPNYNHRDEYWYTKTININIDGAIPNMDMQKIKDCYNNGITFWRNPGNIQDYSVTNGIL